MKIFYRVALVLAVVCQAMATNSFAGQKKYGQEISNSKVTPIRDILANPKAFEGKLVTIEGKIASECMSGCWFNVKVQQGNAVIYVDIGKSGFAIPQHTGKKVLVEGTVVVQKTGPIIQGRGVVVR